jgi:hypothetical protein
MLSTIKIHDASRFWHIIYCCLYTCCPHCSLKFSSYPLHLTSKQPSLLIMPQSNTTVHNIGDRFWPTKPTTNMTMTEIRQIRFFFPEDAPEAPEGFFAIYDKNLFTRPPSLPTYRTILPNAYINHILRIVNRNAIYIIVHDIVHANNHLASKFKDVKTLLAELRLNIEYNDSVMDAIWEDAENAVLMKKMTMDWRSPELDAWLVIEHLVDNHSPDAKAQYLITKAKSTLEQDPEELGEYLSI